MLPELTSKPVNLVHSGNPETMATYTPEDDCEPLQLHIGRLASDRALQRAAQRHDLDLAALVAFRDGGIH
jgi:hypothetical protein